MTGWARGRVKLVGQGDPTIPVIGSSMHQHWNFGMGKHLDSLAAKEQRTDASTPVRGHDDKVTPLRRGGIDDRLVRVFMLHMQHLTDDACGLRCLRDWGQGCLGMILHALLVPEPGYPRASADWS